MQGSCQANLYNRDRNSGAVLASALILLVSLTLIAVTVAYRTTLDELMAANQRDALNALTIAESGIESGYSEVKANYSTLPDSLCTDNGGQLFNDVVLDGVHGDVGISGGYYNVTAINCDDSGSPIKATLHSVGRVNNAERVVELLLDYEAGGEGGGGGDYVILAETQMVMSNSQSFASFDGSEIALHSNEGFTISGDPETCSGIATCDTDLLADRPDGTISTMDRRLLDPSDPDYVDPATIDPYDPGNAYYIDTTDPASPYYGYTADQVNEVVDQMLATEWIDGDIFDYWDKTLNSEVVIPDIDPLQFLPVATIELTADCRVLAGPAWTGSWNGTTYSPGDQIWDENTQGGWEGFACDPYSRWKNDGTPTGYEGFFFIWGNAEFNSMPTSWTASFAAAGSLKITAKSKYLTPYYGEANYGPKTDWKGVDIGSYGRTSDRLSGDTAADHILMLAGNDINITSEGYIDNGLLAAGGEFKLSNQGTWIGGIMAKNYDSQQYTGTVTLEDGRVMEVMPVKNHISRNELTNQGMFAGSGIGLGAGGDGTGLTAIAWREIID